MTNNYSNLQSFDYRIVESAIKASVYSYISSNGSSSLRREDIEDVCSDAMYKALSKADTFNPKKASLKTWASTIGINTLRDALTAQGRKNKLFTSSDEGWSYDNECASTYEISSVYSIEDEYIASETNEIVNAFVSSCSKTEQTIFDLNELGYKPGEIAKQIGKTSNSVSVQKHRMLERLSAALEAA